MRIEEETWKLRPMKRRRGGFDDVRKRWGGQDNTRRR